MRRENQPPLLRAPLDHCRADRASSALNNRPKLKLLPNSSETDTYTRVKHPMPSLRNYTLEKRGRMKAIVFERNGGCEVLQYKDTPIPRPGPNEVLILVKASACNF